MTEPVRVFVSYASPDRVFAEMLVGDLRAAGAEVWWDVSGIDEGDFLGKINQALQQCQWLVLVLTPNAVASKWVNIEVNAGINRREKGLMRGVLPMLASPMAHDAIPPVWDNLHRYDGVGNYSSEVARLTATIGLSDPPARPSREQPAVPVAPPARFPSATTTVESAGSDNAYPTKGSAKVAPAPLGLRKEIWGILLLLVGIYAIQFLLSLIDLQVLRGKLQSTVLVQIPLLGPVTLFSVLALVSMITLYILLSRLNLLPGVRPRQEALR
jgi:hypothetical protein